MEIPVLSPRSKETRTGHTSAKSELRSGLGCRVSGVEPEDLATGEIPANLTSRSGPVEFAVRSLDERGAISAPRDALQQRAAVGRDAHNGAASGSHESSEPEIPVGGSQKGGEGSYVLQAGNHWKRMKAAAIESQLEKPRSAIIQHSIKASVGGLNHAAKRLVTRWQLAHHGECAGWSDAKHVLLSRAIEAPIRSLDQAGGIGAVAGPVQFVNCGENARLYVDGEDRAAADHANVGRSPEHRGPVEVAIFPHRERSGSTQVRTEVVEILKTGTLLADLEC